MRSLSLVLFFLILAGTDPLICNTLHEPDSDGLNIFDYEEGIEREEGENPFPFALSVGMNQGIYWWSSASLHDIEYFFLALSILVGDSNFTSPGTPERIYYDVLDVEFDPTWMVGPTVYVRWKKWVLDFRYSTNRLTSDTTDGWESLDDRMDWADMIETKIVLYDKYSFKVFTLVRLSSFEGTVEYDSPDPLNPSIMATKTMNWSSKWYKQGIYFVDYSRGSEDGEAGLGLSYAYHEIPVVLNRFSNDNQIPEIVVDYGKINRYFLEFYGDLSIDLHGNVKWDHEIYMRFLFGVGYANLHIPGAVRKGGLTLTTEMSLAYQVRYGHWVTQVGGEFFAWWDGYGRGGEWRDKDEDEIWNGRKAIVREFIGGPFVSVSYVF